MFIYVIVNSATLKLYIGQHKGTDLRKYLQQKLSHAMHNEATGSHLFASMRKYPKEVWSIHPLLSDLQTREECNHWETFYIKALKSQHPDVGYNICRGGEGFTGSFSEESKRRMSEAHKAYWAALSEAERKVVGQHMGDAHRGRKCSPEFVEMLRVRATGKKQSPETIAKRSASLKVVFQTPEARAWFSAHAKEGWASGAHVAHMDALRGVPRPPEVIAAWHSPEAQAKSAATRTGMHLSPEHAAGISERKKKWWAEHPNYKFSAERNAKFSATMTGRPSPLKGTHRTPLSPEHIAKIKATKALQRRDITGMVSASGMLTVVRHVGQDKHGNALVLCRCSCEGKEIPVLVYNFINGHTKSCGCLNHRKGVPRSPETIAKIKATKALKKRRQHAPKSRQHRNPVAVSSRRVHESRH